MRLFQLKQCDGISSVVCRELVINFKDQKNDSTGAQEDRFYPFGLSAALEGVVVAAVAAAVVAVVHQATVAEDFVQPSTALTCPFSASALATDRAETAHVDLVPDVPKEHKIAAFAA